MQSGLLQQRLDVLQQPVTLLTGGVRIPERGTIEHRFGAREQRIHQHRQLHGRITGLGHAVAGRETILPSGRHRPFDQAALTEPRAALNKPAGPGPAPQPGQVIAQRGQLAVPAAQRIHHGVRALTRAGGPANPRAAGPVWSGIRAR